MPCIPLEIIIIIIAFGCFISFITREPKKPGKSVPKREKYSVDVNIIFDAKTLFSNLKDLSKNGEIVFKSFFEETNESIKEGEEREGQEGGG